MPRFAPCLLTGSLLLAFAAGAYAQYPGESESEGASEGVGAAKLDVKLSGLEEQMRKLQGTVEQVAYENKQLRAQMEKSNGDLQYRLDALEKKQALAPATSAVPAAPATAEPATLDDTQLRPVEPADTEKQPKAAAAKNVSASPKFASSREQYNYAFNVLRQAKYDEASKQFIAFTKAYPKDPLIGHAYYWLGETEYVQRDYVKAADNFRQGYEAMPAGPKAPDNLLKLAMTLDALSKDKEACVVLKQVVAKFGGSGSSVKPKAEQEINRIGCN